MSLLFNRLDIPRAQWTDADFSQVYNSPKYVNYQTLFKQNPITWQNWWAYVERQKPQPDYNKPPFWLSFMRSARKCKYNLSDFYVSEAMLEHLRLATPYFEAEEAQAMARLEAEQAATIAEWRKTKRKMKVLKDGYPKAYIIDLAPEDEAAMLAKTKAYKDCRRIICEKPLTTLDAQVEVVRIYDETNPAEHKLKNLVVECWNYGLTYSPEDMLAINQGVKQFERCKPIVKEYPCPVITIHEEVKTDLLKRYQPNRLNGGLPWGSVYTRSDQAEYDKRQAAYKPRPFRIRVLEESPDLMKVPGVQWPSQGVIPKAKI